MTNCIFSITRQMHKELDERLQAVIEEHREARKQDSIGDEKRRRQDFVDVLLDLPGENGEEHLDDITIKALVLVRNSSTCKTC